MNMLAPDKTTTPARFGSSQGPYADPNDVPMEVYGEESITVTLSKKRQKTEQGQTTRNAFSEPVRESNDTTVSENVVEMETVKKDVDVDVRHMRFDTIAELESVIASKTSQYNELRQRLMQPIFYDVNLRRSQNTFRELSKDIDYLKEKKSSMLDDGFIIGDIDMSAMITDVLKKSGSLLNATPSLDGSDTPKMRFKESHVQMADVGESYTHMEISPLDMLARTTPCIHNRKCTFESAASVDESLSKWSACVQTYQLRKMQKETQLQQTQHNQQQTQKKHTRGFLKPKEVSDKDKPETGTPEGTEDRRIKHKISYDEHTVHALLSRESNVSIDISNAKVSPSSSVIRSGDVLCQNCGHVCDMDEQHAVYVCCSCGTVNEEHKVHEGDMFQSVNMMSTSKTCVFKTKASTYKPLGHFMEIMYQLQGKRKSKAPYHVKNLCRQYCVSYGIKRNDINEKTIRNCLRRYRNGSQYYKYAMEIACELRGVPPPYMTETQESILTYLYPCTVHAYRSSKRYLTRKSNRVGRIKELPNNMIGNYVLYKLCELCGFTEFLPYIRLSKNVDNINENDESWKHVCEQNKWKFYKTKYYG
ncbi:MAG: hypothetical protein PHN45_01965 [Methylococcales bacterium]|nr:hypothetical protein [Methylococcales bacterium]